MAALLWAMGGDVPIQRVSLGRQQGRREDRHADPGSFFGFARQLGASARKKGRSAC